MLLNSLGLIWGPLISPVQLACDPLKCVIRWTGRNRGSESERAFPALVLNYVNTGRMVQMTHFLIHSRIFLQNKWNISSKIFFLDWVLNTSWLFSVSNNRCSHLLKDPKLFNIIRKIETEKCLPALKKKWHFKLVLHWVAKKKTEEFSFGIFNISIWMIFWKKLFVISGLKLLPLSSAI